MNIILDTFYPFRGLLITLFGPGRFFLYFVGAIWIFRNQIVKTILYNQILEKVKDFLFWYEYRTQDRELVEFINTYFDNYLFMLINVDKNYKEARAAKRKRKRVKYYDELCDDILYYFPHIRYNDNYNDE